MRAHKLLDGIPCFREAVSFHSIVGPGATYLRAGLSLSLEPGPP